MYPACKFFFKAGIDRAMSLQECLSREILADKHNAKMRFGSGTAPVPGTLIQYFHMGQVEGGMQPLLNSLAGVHGRNGTPPKGRASLLS